MKKLTLLSTVFCLLALSLQTASAKDNELSSKEKKAGWELLFNGKDYTGWKCNNGKEIASPVENHAMVPHKSGGYIIIHEKQFGDFVLKCDVKMPEECNSGIFFRVGNPKDPVQTGYEIQVMTGSGTGYHDFGAIYDLVAPSENRSKKSGKWNHMKITCKGPLISISVNGKEVAKMNCDEFTEPNKRPDGTKHKFKTAVKDFPRKGYLGFQDHGHKVWYKNVKIRDLSKK